MILLDVCVSYDTRFDTIHNIEKSKIDSRYNSRFDNYSWDHSCQIVNRFFFFMYCVSYRIVYRKIHKHYIKFIKHYTYTYIYYKIETYANNDHFNYYLCYSI